MAAAILAAWAVVQLWPSGTDEGDPTSTATVTALPPTATPKPSAPPPGVTTSVTLTAGTAACRTRDVTITPSIASPQFAQQPVVVDVAVSTTGEKPCTFTPKELDPLAIVTHDDDTVWDSSICETAIVAQPVQLIPGWARTAQILWDPRESGDACEPDEDWLEPGDYTLRVGTLGGEPGRADFELVEPPPPPTPEPTPAPTEPVPAELTPPPEAPE